MELSDRYLNPSFKVVTSNGYMGIMGNTNELLIDFIITEIVQVTSRFILAKSHQSYFIIKSNGQKLDLSYYDDIKSCSEGCFSTMKYESKRTEKWGFIDENANQVIGMDYQWADSFNGGLVAVQQNDKFGFIDKQANPILPFEYEDAKSFSEGLAAVKRNGKWGYIDKSGNVIITFKFKEAKSFSEGIAAAKYLTDEGYAYWGYINKLGVVVIQGAEYYETNSFINGLATVATSFDQYILINKFGDNIGGKEFCYIGPFINENAIIAVGHMDDEYGDHKYGVIDSNGVILIDAIYDKLSRLINTDFFVAGFSRSVTDSEGKTGLINPKGEIIVPFKYDSIDSFFNGLAKVCVNLYDTKYYNKYESIYGFVNVTGGVVIPLIYEKAEPFIFENTLVKKSGKFTFINTNGIEVSNFRYDMVDSFSNGIYRVGLNDLGQMRFGFVDKNGYQISRIIFEDALPYSEGLAAIKFSGKWSYIDINGNIISEFCFDEAKSFTHGLAPVKKGCKWGYINKMGNIKIEYKFETATSFDEGVEAWVSYRGRTVAIDINGSILTYYDYD